MEEVIAFLAQGAPSDEEGLVGLRRWVDGLGCGLEAPAQVEARRTMAEEVAVVRFIPPHCRPDAALLYLHGGAFVAGSAASHGSLAANLAAATGLETVLPEYRLAPENPYPAALQDARVAFLSLVHNGRHVAVAGDSAGGNLAIALALDLVARGAQRPVCLSLLSPWTDLSLSGASIHTKADVDPMLTAEALRTGAAAYAGPMPLRDPRLSPLFADMSGLPPLQVQVGGRERVLDDSLRLVARARAAEIEVEYEEWPDMVHVWPLFGRWLPEGAGALSRMARFIAHHVDATTPGKIAGQS